MIGRLNMGFRSLLLSWNFWLGLLILLIADSIPLPNLVFYQTVRIGINLLLLALALPLIIIALGQSSIIHNKSIKSKLIILILIPVGLLVGYLRILPRIVFYELIYFDTSATLGGLGIGLISVFFLNLEPKNDMMNQIPRTSIELSNSTDEGEKADEEIQKLKGEYNGFLSAHEYENAEKLGFLSKIALQIAQSFGISDSHELRSNWNSILSDSKDSLNYIDLKSLIQTIEKCETPQNLENMEKIVDERLERLLDLKKQLESITSLLELLVEETKNTKDDLLADISNKELRKFQNECLDLEKKIDTNLESIKNAIEERKKYLEPYKDLVNELDSLSAGNSITISKLALTLHTSETHVLELANVILRLQPNLGKYESVTHSINKPNINITKPIITTASTNPTISSTPNVVDADIFISFSSHNRSTAENLFNALINQGFKPWISTISIDIGQDYSEQIINAIDRTNYFILLISESSITSRHVKTELERGFSKNSTILPIKLTTREIPTGWQYYLSTSQWKDYSNYSDDSWIADFVIHLVRLKSQSTGNAAEYVESLDQDHHDNRCLLCLTELEDLKHPCPSCGQVCEICKRPIRVGETWTTCASQKPDACLNTFHQKEYLEWIRSHGTCPYCKQAVHTHMYESTVSLSEKIALLVAQDLEIETSNQTEMKRIQDDALGTVISTSKLWQMLENMSNQMNNLEEMTSEKFENLLSLVQPLTRQYEFIRETTYRIEQNMLTQEQLDKAINQILENLSVVEDNLDILVEAHKKNESLLNKIKNNVISSIGQEGFQMIMQDTDMSSLLNGYVEQPSVGILRSLLGKVRSGIANTAKNPKSWLKLASFLFIL